jgi:two-component system chemotaxis response regulator CheY
VVQPSASGDHVLVVDDDDAIRLLVIETLRFEGFPVAEAAHGAAAVAAIEAAPPAVVLLDMRMPVLDGWGVARWLRERGGGVPVVVMTAASDAGRWAEEIAAEGVLSKPFDVDDLVQIVGRYLRPRA